MADATIVLFGATGYTGRLTAEAMVADGLRPVLAGRGAGRLNELADELGGGLAVEVVDAERPDGSVLARLDAGDVLVTTVGPFLQRGGPALRAAIDAGAHYLDSTGEPPFVRQVFERCHREAAGRCALVTAFGYDFVPGNLAGALAVRDAGEDATRVDVGYFATGDLGTDAASTGTIASLAGVVLEQGHAWRGGALVRERSARDVRTFTVHGSSRPAVSVGGSEHYGLPAIAPQLDRVGTYLGWFGPASRVLQALSLAGEAVARLPGVRATLRSLSTGLSGRTGDGPDAEARERTGSYVVAVASSEDGDPLAEVHLEGPNPYTFTGRILAWGAGRAAREGPRATGALGPVEAFGLEALEAGCAHAGLRRT